MDLVLIFYYRIRKKVLFFVLRIRMRKYTCRRSNPDRARLAACRFGHTAIR